MNVGSLQVKQLALDVESAAIATQRSSGGDDAMAGNNDGDRIPIVGHADGAEGPRVPDDASDISIAARLAVRDRAQRLPAGELKLGATKIERHRELTPFAGKVLVEFANVGCQVLLRLLKLNFPGVQIHYARFKFKPDQAFG